MVPGFEVPGRQEDSSPQARQVPQFRQTKKSHPVPEPNRREAKHGTSRVIGISCPVSREDRRERGELPQGPRDFSLTVAG